MKLDAQGRVLTGNSIDVAHFPTYRADVMAIADTAVVEVLDHLPEQVPPHLPDPAGMALDNFPD